MNNEIIKETGIKWGPFRLRIPFLHMKFLTSEVLQGLVISGATALARAIDCLWPPERLRPFSTS